MLFTKVRNGCELGERTLPQAAQIAAPHLRHDATGYLRISNKGSSIDVYKRHRMFINVTGRSHDVYKRHVDVYKRPVDVYKHHCTAPGLRPRRLTFINISEYVTIQGTCSGQDEYTYV